MSGTDTAVSEVTAISRLGTKLSRSSPVKSSRSSSSALEQSRMLELPRMAAAGMQEALAMSGAVGTSVLLSGGFSRMDSRWGDAGGSCIIESTASSSILASPGSLQVGLWEARTCSSLSFSFSRLAISPSRADFSSSRESVSWGANTSLNDHHNVLHGHYIETVVIMLHTYSLKGVYQLPPSVATLCCSNLIPLPPDPSPLLLLFGGLKINMGEKTVKQHRYCACYTVSHVHLTPRLPRKQERKTSSSQGSEGAHHVASGGSAHFEIKNKTSSCCYYHFIYMYCVTMMSLVVWTETKVNWAYRSFPKYRDNVSHYRSWLWVMGNRWFNYLIASLVIYQQGDSCPTCSLCPFLL